jgi:outer membrane protein OmpA-like peptidoglycan-associated protein
MRASQAEALWVSDEIRTTEASSRAKPLVYKAAAPASAVEDAQGPTAQVISAATLVRLQRHAGNAAVADLLGSGGRLLEPAARRLADPLRAGPALGSLPTRGPVPRRIVVQRDFAGSFPTKLGGFEMDMITHNDAPAAPSGMKGTIKFVPNPKGPYTNKLGIVQVVKLTDDKVANVEPVSVPSTTGPHIRTKEDKAKGVEGGFFTDVLHQDAFTNPKKPPVIAPKGSAQSPYYPFSNAGAQKFGFRRSENPDDIQAAEMFDFPGTASTTAAFDFSFETVAKGDDNLLTYGAVKWSFSLRKGKVENENMSVTDGSSATFGEALGKHRAFYVHEPVTMYFEFGRDSLVAGETAKIDTFLQYLADFPDVRMKLTGFADRRGDPAFNLALSQRRSEAVAQALVTKGIDAGRVDAPVGLGATESFTPGAKTPQDAEANRHGNRRVTIDFFHPPVPKKGP